MPPHLAKRKDLRPLYDIRASRFTISTSPNKIYHLKVESFIREVHRLVEILLAHEAPWADGVGDHVDLDKLPASALGHGLYL